jgi:hypothetical protein
MSPESRNSAVRSSAGTAIARQRLGKHVPAATNTHATIEEMLNASFSMRSVSYQRARTSCNVNPLINLLNTTNNHKKFYEFLLLKHKLKSQWVLFLSEQEEASKLPPCRVVPEVRPKPRNDRWCWCWLDRCRTETLLPRYALIKSSWLYRISAQQQWHMCHDPQLQC